MSVRTYYDILNVSPRAGDAEVRRAYRALAMRWHPDRNPANRERCAAVFAQIHRAYSLIQTEPQRALYNRHLVAYIRERRMPSRRTAIETNQMMRKIASARLAAIFARSRRAIHG